MNITITNNRSKLGQQLIRQTKANEERLPNCSCGCKGVARNAIYYNGLPFLPYHLPVKPVKLADGHVYVV